MGGLSWDWAKWFIGNGTNTRKLNNIYIDSPLKTFEWCIGKATKFHCADSSLRPCWGRTLLLGKGFEDAGKV